MRWARPSLADWLAGNAQHQRCRHVLAAGSHMASHEFFFFFHLSDCPCNYLALVIPRQPLIHGLLGRGRGSPAPRKGLLREARRRRRRRRFWDELPVGMGCLDGASYTELVWRRNRESCPRTLALSCCFSCRPARTGEALGRSRLAYRELVRECRRRRCRCRVACYLRVDSTRRSFRVLSPREDA